MPESGTERGLRWLLTALVVAVLGALVGFALSLCRVPSPSQSPSWVSKPMPPSPPAPAPSFQVEEEALRAGKPGPSEGSASHPKGETAVRPAGPAGTEPSKKTPTAVPVTSFAFTLHVESFRDPLAAHKRVEFYKALGLESFLKKVEIPGKGTFHRVFVGRFQRREEAEALRKRLEKHYGLHGGRVMRAQDLQR